jgi:hypothetical protein
MMKKLLVILTVLALATMANAAIHISLDGNITIDEITIDPSDTITIDVYDDQAGGYVDWMHYLDIGPIDNSVYTLSNARLGGGAGDYASFVQGTYNGYDDIEITQADTSAPDPDPGAVFLIDLHCEGSGDVYIYIYDGGDFSVIDSAVIHQTPEPMTIALLGLGGLLLRRRK